MGGASSTFPPGARGVAGANARTAFRRACARAARADVAACAADLDRIPGPAAIWAGPHSGRGGRSGSSVPGDSRGARVSARVNILTALTWVADQFVCVV